MAFIMSMEFLTSIFFFFVFPRSHIQSYFSIVKTDLSFYEVLQCYDIEIKKDCSILKGKNGLYICAQRLGLIADMLRV